MTNICSHLPTNREEAVVEGSNDSATNNSDENVLRSEAVTETMDGSEARADMLSVIRTKCFACTVSDDDDDDDDDDEKERKKKIVLDMGETSKRPNWWQNILGASSSAGVCDVQKKDENKLKGVLDSCEISSNRPNPRLSNPPNNLNGELVAAGWPSWLCAVAGEAIYGWTPRRADSFEKLDKIGQGSRCNVYKGRDVMTGKIVALKKVQFDNLEPESVKFMAREILLLRRLDHPNVIKLEGLVTWKMSSSLYLVFEYMEHDLAGLAVNPRIKFTEPQVKCYMHQLLLGLEYCHHHGVLHRDINGSNLLIDNGGILKIAGFGSASFFDPNCKLPMTSQVTTLSYRPPELLMGSSDYSVGVDLWSMGCVLAELLAGKPVMPGRTEVEQLYKIFKLCGSPSEEYWKKLKLPHTTIFKLLEPKKQCIAETFKDFPPSSLPLIETLLAIDPVERQTATAALRSKFFTVEPYACEPSDLPKYPSKEDVNAKHQEEKDRHRVSGGKPNVDGQKKIHTRDQSIKAVPASEANVKLQANSENILGASSPGGVSDGQKKDVFDSGETSSNRPNSRLRTRPNPRLSNPPNHLNGELVAAGWPSWLCAVAGEAIYGWTPRRADSFEKLDKIGQGCRSNVYKGRDLMTGKFVALKKVQFDNLEPESVKFMAREILMLRRLDHPNVIKLEGLVTSKTSCSLYLVFEYMEHDLAGLAENPGIKFTEPQVKCYMYQLLLGLEYCHYHGILHRNINGSNLLIDNEGILKIAGFGSASFFDPNLQVPLTTRLATLWYQPPELLFEATDYGIGVDLWSMGCVLAELLAGKPIMPGRTKVEQLFKIFKLCGSSEKYWEMSKIPQATIFKPQQPYKPCIAETFKDFPPLSLPLIETLLAIDPVERQTATAALRSEFFTVEPYACDPSNLPKYPSEKDVDSKQQEEKARHRASGGKPNVDGQKKICTCDRALSAVPASEANVELQANSKMKGNINEVVTKTSFAKELSRQDRFCILGGPISRDKPSGLHSHTWNWRIIDGS